MAFALVLPLDPQSWGIIVPVSVSAKVAQQLTGSLLLTLLLTTEGAVYRAISQLISQRYQLRRLGAVFGNLLLLNFYHCSKSCSGPD